MIASDVSGLRVPLHGGQLPAIAHQFGVPAQDILDFSVNINPDGPPPSVLAALSDALSNPASIAAYPDAEYGLLKQSISGHLGVSAECVLVGNGFVPLLQATLTTLGAHCCLLPVPAFSEYRASLEQAGVEVIPCPLEPLDFRYNSGRLLDSLRQQIKRGKRSILLLANPQNPSGMLTGANLLLELVRDAARLDVAVLVDEAFIDYAPSQSIAAHAASLPNLVVFRSVTKVFSIPSLRVAYAVCSEERAREIAQAIAIWPVSTLASVAATTALLDLNYAVKSQRMNLLRRESLASSLRDLGLGSYPSEANFLLLKLPPDLDPGSIWRDLILSEHVLTRSCENFESLSSPHLRVAVRKTVENQRLVAAVRRVLSRHCR